MWSNYVSDKYWTSRIVINLETSPIEFPILVLKYWCKDVKGGDKGSSRRICVLSGTAEALWIGVTCLMPLYLCVFISMFHEVDHEAL